jgi:hypothetical protein
MDLKRRAYDLVRQIKTPLHPLRSLRLKLHRRDVPSQAQLFFWQTQSQAY